MDYKTLKIALVISVSFLWTSCYYFDKSWETIYSGQEKLFNDNRNTFELSATTLNSSNIYDTTLSVKNKYLQLPDTLIKRLKKIGISRIDIHKTNCTTKDIRFIPDSPLWYSDKFFMLEIRFDKCDDRNRKGYHWKLESSEHKHSFGQGDGWFIYSDTDFL